MFWTEYTYDELGRVKTVKHPPNTGTSGNSGTTTYDYVLNMVRVADPAGRWKRHTMDGFGSLKIVAEPKPTGGSYITTYTYSMFGELLKVSMPRDGFDGHTAQQVTQTRTFQYTNGLLTSTTFPETPGSTTYGYQGEQLLWKKNYKGIWKYFYTAAKQLARVEKYPGATSYASAVNEDKNQRVTYHYDGHPLTTDFVSENVQGRLAAIEYNCGTTGTNCTREFYSYTPGGRLKKKRLDVLNVVDRVLEVGFTYDAEGKLQHMVYPSGKVVKYTYDDFARHTGLREVQPGGAEPEIVNNLTYGAAGELKSMSWLTGVSTWAGQTWAYNNRMQMTNYAYSGPGGPVSHTYQYSATQNDGKLWRRKENVSGQEVEYTYDLLNRLTIASVLAGTGPAGQEWGQTYVYDGFGNMKQKIGYALAVNTGFNVPMNSATNNGGAAGGDMDDRILTNSGETYKYAPDNKRISKQFQSGYNNHVTLWVGNLRVGTYGSEWTGNGFTFIHTTVKEDLYVAGRRVAPSDRLGSDLTGGIKLLPYGEELQPPNVPNDRTKFATYHRDATGVDYADQRYYAPGTGRFLTSDPYLASGGPSAPSSWNRYAYVEGDPVNHVDPRGLQTCVPDGRGGYDCAAGSGPLTGSGGAPLTSTSVTVTDSSQGCNPDPPYNCDGDDSSYIWHNYQDLRNLQNGWGGMWQPAPGPSQYALAVAPPPNPCDETRSAMDRTIAGEGMPGGKSMLTRVVENLYGSPDQWKGHMEQIDNYRGRLLKFLDQWRKDDCGDPPSGVTNWLTATRTNNLEAARRVVDLTRQISEIGAGVAAGYGIYRGVRLLPSLLPPFWWTLPVNVAVP